MLDISVVVPLYNEERVVEELHRRLSSTLVALKRPYEIIFVDDCSSDQTLKLVGDLARSDSSLKVLKLFNNFGQTAALAAGVDFSSGRYIIAMDGDLQHVPEEIPEFIEKLDEGYDIVSGWRKKRVDNLISRRIPSKIANYLMRKLSGIALHDFGTTYKAYRREILESVRLYGQFHRFIPVLCRGVSKKVKICEIPIQNINRPVGKSNYGIMRAVTVLFDLIRLKFLMTFSQKPLQLFGTIAFVLNLIGFLLFFYILFLRIFSGITLSTLGSAIFVSSIFFVLAGMQFLFFGLIAELMVKLYYDGHKVRCYIVEKAEGDFPNPIHFKPSLPNL